MAAGRKPKPTALKVLEGNPGKRPLNEHEPKPKLVRPACPAWLNTEGKKKWRELAPQLETLGLLTALDGAALAAACQRWGTFVECEKYMATYGRVMTTSTGYEQQRPEESIAKAALADYYKFMAEFGMAPASRSRISVEGANKKKSSKLSSLLSG